jgi:hypothetical protein
MPQTKHEGWAEPFQDDATVARSKHQTALGEAHRQFAAAREKAKSEQRADYVAARDAFDALKPTPDDPAYAETRDAYERSKVPASLSAARRALAEAIEAADLQLKLDLVRAGAHHNVSVGLEHDPRYNPNPR